MSVAYITETWLRDRFELDHGSEIQLPAGSRLTPSAEGLLAERRIVVKYTDADGRVVEDVAVWRRESESQPVLSSDSKLGATRVNPLTGDSVRHEACCELCRQPVGKKPDAMTHIDKNTLVPKNDPRLKLRGKIDTAIAQAVLLQERFDPEKKLGPLAGFLADVRSGLGNVLKAEATGEPLVPIRMGGMDAGAIHAVSHNPLKFLGRDHLVPELGQGLRTASLNLLRAFIREAELAADDVYIARDFTVTRPDIMEGLNRLSSAVYVLMLLTSLAEQGKAVSPERIGTEQIGAAKT